VLRRPLLALLIALCVLPATAGAVSKRAASERNRPAAERALERVERLQAGRGVRTGHELTPALRELAIRYRALEPADRARARRLLARPTDGVADPDGYTVPEAAPYCTTNFCVHYVTSTADAPSLASNDGDGIPDYVQDMADEFEFAHARETGPGPAGLGWREPVSDGSRGEPAGSGTTGRTDIYLSELAGTSVLGFATTDAGQPGATQFAYVVMDDDYAGRPSPLETLQSTAAHEYNHVLQYAYDVNGDAWMYESTAVWMEDQVHDAIDEWLGFLTPPSGWVTTTELPITLESTPRMYGSGVWNHWLSERYGTGAIRSAWELSQTASPASFAPAAYDGSIAAAGGTGFSDDFARFSAATAEWRAPGSGFSEGSTFPDVERLGGLSVGDFPATIELDHTTFALFDVTPTAAGAFRLNVAAPEGTSSAIALVGRTGADPAAGTTTTRFRMLPAGGAGSVELASPGSFGRITAVVVNADASQAGFGSTDWNYTKDDAPFDVELEGLMAPSTPPANSALPAISGTATDSGTLNASDGTWSGTPPFTFTRQWRRCDSAGANCANIAGATGASYSPVAADLGKRLRVRVTATNSADSATAESAASAVIQPSAPSNTAVPEISGTPAEGQELTATTGTWKGTPPLAFAYQWQRCDAAGANCLNIGAATASAYTLVSDDVGKRVRVQVRATNAQSPAGVTAVSAVSTLVSGTAPLDEDPPTATGTARTGETLTAGNGTWSGTVPMTFTRQWRRCDADGLACADIGGATGTTYTLTDTDIGKRIRVRVTATNAAGSRSADSAARGPVLPLAPTNSAPPAIDPSSGLRDGDSVDVVEGAWSGHGTITTSHQWLRCNAAGSGCVDIAGATGSSYTLTADDVGKTLRVRETGSNDGGPGTPVQSAATAVVGARPPANTLAPAISGTAQAGQTLTGTDGGWSGTAPIALTRRWLRCDAGGAACAAIPFATASSYVPVAADVGSTLKLEVTATNGGGGAVALSAPTAAVAAAPDGGGGGDGGDGGDGSGGGGGDEPIELSATYEVGRSFAMATVRKRGLPFRIECNTACTARADLFIPAKVAKRLGISARRQVKIGTGSAQLTAAGSRAGKVKLTKKAAKRLRRTRRLTATLTIVIKDAAGVATAPVSLRVKLGG
jgi:hypothetical protein